MKAFRFSLSGLLAFVVVVATVISLGGGLASQSSLRPIWVASLLLSYWKSPVAGWRQIVRVTATTGVIWSISILWAYALFANFANIDTMPTVLLASHGGLVALVGIVFAAGTAFLVEGLRWTWHIWRQLEVRRRVSAVLVLLLSITFGWGTWTITRPRYWEPALVAKSAESERGEFAYLDQIKQRHDLVLAYIVGCADGRFIAARLFALREVLVFDAVTGELVARFGAGDGAWFGRLAFRPDSSALAAILYSKSSGPKLVQWDTASWKPLGPVPIDSLLVPPKPGDYRSFSLDDRFLIIVDFRDALREKAKVDIFTVDLLEDQFTPRRFASATIELNKLAARNNDNLAPDTISWMVAPNGKWLATSGDGGSDFRDYLFWTKANPVRLQGRVIGFMSDGEHVVVCEKSVRLVWKEVRQKLEPRPPFWNHLRFLPLSRVLILNCRNQQTVAQSRWMQISRPHMTPNRSRLLLERTPQSVLVWKLPEIRR
ncbi:MAG: hypothetical protein QGG71_25220 [Pirellulaceae bacterium]|jgi:hypothetical protein|nr:hypothetical protein [Pirellulaceae bacterium]